MLKKLCLLLLILLLPVTALAEIIISEVCAMNGTYMDEHAFAVLDNIRTTGQLSKEDEETLNPIVKAADKLSALIKCIEEKKAGSSEFTLAAKSTRESIESMGLKEAEVYLEEILPAYDLTLDELKS